MRARLCVSILVTLLAVFVSAGHEDDDGKVEVVVFGFFFKVATSCHPCISNCSLNIFLENLNIFAQGHNLPECSKIRLWKIYFFLRSYDWY